MNLKVSKIKSSDHHTVVTTCTRDCTNTCGLLAVVENGRLQALKGNPDHPYTRGRVCHKASKFVQRIYSPERILHPLRRVNGQWQRIGWDEALDEIADRMKSIQQEFGPEAILYYQGYGGRTALKLLNKRFFNLLGGVTTTYGSLCGGTGQAAQDLDLGCRVSHDPLDHKNASSMILWGRNPVTTNIGLLPIIKEIRKKGAPVILVDPRPSKSRHLCDLHIRLAPGSDAFLAMAVAKQILVAGHHDRGFLKEYSLGFEDFQRILDCFCIDELAGRCDVPLAQIDQMADILMAHHPTATLLGWGLHRWEHAHYAIRSIDALAAITGNIGVPGGGVSQGFEEYGPYDPEGWGDEKSPRQRKLLMAAIGQEIMQAEDPPVKMIFVTAANPVCMAPNSNKVARAFDQTEFVVVVGHFLDDTSDYADIFLPSTTFVEEKDVMASFGHNYVGPVNQAIEPLGECRSDFEMFKSLAKRFDFGKEYIRDIDIWLKRLLKPLIDQGYRYNEILESPVRCKAPMVPYADKGFPTSSGKFHFMTEFDPQLLTVEDEIYPYHLISVVAHNYIGSELCLSEHSEFPLIRMHPAECEKKCLKDGDLVEVRSLVGRLKARLVLDPVQRRDMVVTQRGGWIKAGHGINQLTMDLPSKVGHGTPYHETRVNVFPVNP